MGLQNLATDYKPTENQEFSNKKLIGDAVCTVTLETLISKKNNKKWYKLTGEVINAIADTKGRETNLISGDEITKMYDPEDDSSLQKLMNDLFTAGINYEAGADEDSTFANMASAAKDKLVYYRTWVKELSADMKVKYPNNTTGYFQNINILSSNKLTPENQQAQLPI